MPKLKTKSGAKKRFKVTGTGKVKVAAQGKRHGMIKRPKRAQRAGPGAGKRRAHVKYILPTLASLPNRLTETPWHASSAALPPTPSTKKY
jgi:ribosomal protein L35